MNRLLFSFILLTVMGQLALAQTPLTGPQAYEYLQGERGRARRIAGEATNPPMDSLKKADQVLAAALTYYERADVQALAKDNRSLLARKGDILFDKAALQIRMGQTDAAAQSLLYDLQGEGAPFYAKLINEFPVYEPVRKHPLIAPLLAKGQVGDRLFNSSALKTPYQPTISEDERIAGLSKVWSEAKYNFAYFDHVPDLDWDKLYLTYLPKMRAARSTVEYYDVLRSFCAQLHDGHTGVWANETILADSVARRPPIRAVLVEDKVLVQEVLQDSLLRTGIRPMLELVSVDGVPVKAYADRYVRPYVGASSPQNADVNTYVYDLLRGPKNKPVTLVFRDKTGATFSRTLPRTGYANLRATPAFRLRVLPGNVAYVQLNNFDSDEAQEGFMAAFDSIAATSALILDVRQNGGGDSGQGWNILACLTDKPMKTGSYSARLYSPLRRARGSETIKFEPVETGNNWSANGKKLYTKPVVVLTSGQTFSAAEDFAVVFDAMKRGTIIGEPTGGSTGQPLTFSLPGGVMGRVCAKRDMYPDGTEWNGKGIQPTVLVRPTIADLQAGNDTVLNAALAHLGVTGPVPKGKAKKQK
jgi:C-terminal processing protease CtpA/Prc